MTAQTAIQMLYSVRVSVCEESDIVSVLLSVARVVTEPLSAVVCTVSAVEADVVTVVVVSVAGASVVAVVVTVVPGCVGRS